MRRPHTPEHIEKIRLSKKGKKRHDSRINKKKDPLYLKEYRRVYRLKRKQRMREMGFTPEHKKNISLAKKGKPVKKQPTRSCPHCGKDGGYTVMARWHFDNCPNLTKPLLSSQS